MATLKISENQDVLFVRLNRPEVRNAFSPEMIKELTQTFLNVKASHRLVVLSGEGSVFCAGADLNWMKSMVKFSAAENEKDSLQLHDLFAAIRNCPAPVLGVVQGAAFGGGLGLVAACDFVVCGDKTQFCFSEVKLGIVPAVISRFVLEKSTPGLVGPWMVSGRIFKSSQAFNMGLVHEIVDEDELPERESEIVRGFLQAGREATRATKKLVVDLAGWSADQARVQTAKLIADRRSSAEGQEGLQAFLEKRDPTWRQ